MRLAFLSAALTRVLAAAQSYPAEFSVDLVFPRSNAKYKRVFAFPVVLALHGAPEIWPADLSIKLELMRALEKGEPATTFETVYVNATDVVGRLPGDEETYFVVVGMLEAVGSPSEATFLRYEVTFSMDCPPGEAADRLASDFDLESANRVTSSLYFSLDDKKGMEPDVVPAEDVCPYHVQTLLIEGKESDECLLLGTPDYERINENCRTKIPEGFAGLVKGKLEEIGTCANETEPTAEHDAFCDSRPFLLDDEGRTGSDGGGSGGDDADGDDDSGASTWRAGVLGIASSAVLLLSIVALTV